MKQENLPSESISAISDEGFRARTFSETIAANIFVNTRKSDLFIDHHSAPKHCYNKVD